MLTGFCLRQVATSGTCDEPMMGLAGAGRQGEGATCGTRLVKESMGVGKSVEAGASGKYLYKRKSAEQC